MYYHSIGTETKEKIKLRNRIVMVITGLDIKSLVTVQFPIVKLDVICKVQNTYWSTPISIFF